VKQYVLSIASVGPLAGAPLSSAVASLALILLFAAVAAAAPALVSTVSTLLPATAPAAHVWTHCSSHCPRSRRLELVKAFANKQPKRVQCYSHEMKDQRRPVLASKDQSFLSPLPLSYQCCPSPETPCRDQAHTNQTASSLLPLYSYAFPLCPYARVFLTL
jgi:hypothetical protein